MSLLCEASSNYVKDHGILHPDLVHVSTNFINRTYVGPGTVRVKAVKVGKDISTLKAKLFQRQPLTSNAGAALWNPKSLDQGTKSLGKLCVTGLLVFTKRKSATSSQNNTLPTFPALPPPPSVHSDAETFNAPHPVGLHPGFQAVNQVTYRFPVDPMPGLTLGSGSRFGPSVREQWIKFKPHHSQNFTVGSLGVVCDLFLPVLASYSPNAMSGGVPAWSPTVNLTLEVKEQPRKGGREWLFVRIHAYGIKEGRMDNEIWVCDEGGGLVAISRHFALVGKKKRNDQVGNSKSQDKNQGRYKL